MTVTSRENDCYKFKRREVIVWKLPYVYSQLTLLHPNGHKCRYIASVVSKIYYREWNLSKLATDKYMYSSALVHVCTHQHWYMYALISTGTCMYSSPLVHVCTHQHWYMYALISTGTCMHSSALVQVCTHQHWYMYALISTGTCMYSSALVHVCTLLGLYSVASK